MRSFDRDIGAVIARLERHARIADQTAVATELLGAAQFRKETDRRHYEELKIQCERWLKPSNVKHIHLHQVQAKLDGTCEWITSNVVFENWVKPESLTTRDRLLVISGSHGSGKSILASSIVVRLEKAQQHPLFFAFSSSDGNRQTSENLIRTLLGQSLHQSDKDESVDSVHRLRLGGQPSVSELWQVFERIIPLLAKPSYCVIDGVDECLDYSHNLFTRLIQVLEKCPNLRILLLGRSHVIEAHSGIDQFPIIEISPAILNQDIEAFINNEIAKSDILSLPEIRETVYKSLKGKSDGMFLWVRLMIDDLRKSSSKSELSQRLQDLPCGLEKAYRLLFLRLSQKLDKYEQRLAQSVLAFIITSCRPLTFDEFQYAHALHCRWLDRVAKPFEEYLLLQPRQRVLDITEGLIYMAKGVLHLSHSSVRDFLVRPKDRWMCGPDKAVLEFRIDLTQTHRYFAWICLDYIKLETEAKKIPKLDTSHTTQAVWGSCPLLRYAISYAFHHLNRSGRPCSTTIAKVEDLLESTHIVVWAEYFAHLLFEDSTLEAQINEFTAWGDQIIGAGMDNRLLTIFGGTLNKWTDQTKKAGRYDDPLLDHVEVYINEATTKQSGVFSPERGNEVANSVPDPRTADRHLQSSTIDLKQSSNDSSAAISRVMDLVKGQTPLSVSHQIELCLRLSTSIFKARTLIDPLKILFQLILKKASCIPVYALMLIGEFYYKLEKFQEALEVYNTASKKMIRLDVPLRFRIHEIVGDCYTELQSHSEALGYYEEAFSGYETLLGTVHRDTLRALAKMSNRHLILGSGSEALRSYKKLFSGYQILYGTEHHLTLRALKWMIFVNGAMSQHREVIRLSDKICIKYDHISQLNLTDNIHIQYWRYKAYRHVGDNDKAAALGNCLRESLVLLGESCNNPAGIAPIEIQNGGHAHYILGEYETARKFYALALERQERSKHSVFIDISDTQHSLAMTYEALGRYHEARALFEKSYAKEQSVLGPNHPKTRETKRYLENLMLNGFKLEKVESDNAGNDDDECNGSFLDDTAIVDDELDNDESVNDEPDHGIQNRITEPPAQNIVSWDPQIESSENTQIYTSPEQNFESELGPSGESAQGP